MSNRGLNDFYGIDAAKRELALQIRAVLLQARIKVMAQEIFPAHKPLACDILEVVVL